MTHQRLNTLALIAMLALLAGCAGTNQVRQESVSQAGVTGAESNQTYTVTGSRIPRSDSADDRGVYRRGAFPVTVFSREELERTGQVDAATALRRLHPGFH